jgi:hypothetical protein
MSKAQASTSSFGALREKFLLSKYIAGLQAENIKTRGLQILFNRMERMSDNMLLKTIRELSESGALEMAPMPGGNRISTVSIQEAFRLPPTSVKKIVELLEAIEHVERYFREHQIKPSTEGE